MILETFCQISDRLIVFVNLAWLAVFRRYSASLLRWIWMELSFAYHQGYLVIFCCLVALYQELGERGNEMENSEYQRRKADDLQKRLVDAHSSIHHIELVRTSILCLCIGCYEKDQLEISNLQKIDCQICMHLLVFSLYIFMGRLKRSDLKFGNYMNLTSNVQLQAHPWGSVLTFRNLLVC